MNAELKVAGDGSQSLAPAGGLEVMYSFDRFVEQRHNIWRLVETARARVDLMDFYLPARLSRAVREECPDQLIWTRGAQRIELRRVQ